MIDYFGSAARLNERVYPTTASNQVAAVSNDEPYATGMFARPADGVIRLPKRPRANRSARAAMLRRAAE